MSIVPPRLNRKATQPWVPIVPAVLGEDVAELGDRAVAVIGQDGQVNGHAARAVSFENGFFV